MMPKQNISPRLWLQASNVFHRPTFKTCCMLANQCRLPTLHHTSNVCRRCATMNSSPKQLQFYSVSAKKLVHTACCGCWLKQNTTIGDRKAYATLTSQRLLLADATHIASLSLSQCLWAVACRAPLVAKSSAVPCVKLCSLLDDNTLHDQLFGVFGVSEAEQVRLC
jgi:hypothetical protein